MKSCRRKRWDLSITRCHLSYMKLWWTISSLGYAILDRGSQQLLRALFRDLHLTVVKHLYWTRSQMLKETWRHVSRPWQRSQTSRHPWQLNNFGPCSGFRRNRFGLAPLLRLRDVRGMEIRLPSIRSLRQSEANWYLHHRNLQTAMGLTNPMPQCRKRKLVHNPSEYPAMVRSLKAKMQPRDRPCTKF